MYANEFLLTKCPQTSPLLGNERKNGFSTSNDTPTVTLDVFVMLKILCCTVSSSLSCFNEKHNL